MASALPDLLCHLWSRRDVKKGCKVLRCVRHGHGCSITMTTTATICTMYSPCMHLHSLAYREHQILRDRASHAALTHLLQVKQGAAARRTADIVSLCQPHPTALRMSVNKPGSMSECISADACHHMCYNCRLGCSNEVKVGSRGIAVRLDCLAHLRT